MRKREAFNNAIGRSRGGQTTEIHALTDEIGRLRALLITAGNTSMTTKTSTMASASVRATSSIEIRTKGVVS